MTDQTEQELGQDLLEAQAVNRLAQHHTTDDTPQIPGDARTTAAMVRAWNELTPIEQAAFFDDVPSSVRPFQVGDRVRITGWGNAGPNEGTITEIQPGYSLPNGSQIPPYIVTDCRYELPDGRSARAVCSMSADLTSAGGSTHTVELIKAVEDPSPVPGVDADGGVIEYECHHHDVAEAERLAHAEDAWSAYESLRDSIARQNAQRLQSGPSIIRTITERIDAQNEPDGEAYGDSDG